MKTFMATVALAAALVLVLSPIRLFADDDDSASFQTFYDQLAGQGTWIQTQDYGYVWQPTENDPNWRPYMYGHWVNTDQGLTWVSDESFGWATYHYGRWVNLDGYGWVWVPGYTWAPAWVSWRSGDDDAGWAPLPPASDVGIDYFDDDDYFTDADAGFGFHIGGDCDLAYGIGAGCYNFCPLAYIGDRDAWRHFHHRGDNFALINRTHNVTNINFRRDGAGVFGHVTAEGPSVAALNARSETSIPHVALTASSQAGASRLSGDTLAVYAPRINPATMAASRPDAVGETLGNVAANRGTDVNRPMAVNARISPAGPSAGQVNAASLAQGNAVSGAKIARDNTQGYRAMSEPLTALRGDSGRLDLESRAVAREPGGGIVSEGPEQEGYGRGATTFGRDSYGGQFGNRSTAFYPPGGEGYGHVQPEFRASSPSVYSRAPAYYGGQSGYQSLGATHFGGASSFRYSGAGARSYGSGGSYGGGRVSGAGGGVGHVSGGGGGAAFGGRR
jgi:hypothetical protein